MEANRNRQDGQRASPVGDHRLQRTQVGGSTTMPVFSGTDSKELIRWKFKPRRTAVSHRAPGTGTNSDITDHAGRQGDRVMPMR